MPQIPRLTLGMTKLGVEYKHIETYIPHLIFIRDSIIRANIIVLVMANKSLFN